VTVQFAAVYVSAGTRKESIVNPSASLMLRTLPAECDAQLAHATALVESGVALATVRVPWTLPVDVSVHVILNVLAAMLLVAVLLLTAAPVTVRFVIVLAVERTSPVIVADVVHGAVRETTAEMLHVTVPLVTVIVARTGALIVRETIPVEAAKA
jgi:hypothetical protein